MTSQPPRIPNDEVRDCHTWIIPEIDGGKVLPSAEKEERERREREARAKGEVIGETIDSDEFSGPITAAELEKITEQAHQEGYATGFEQGHAEGLKTGSAEGERKAYSEAKEQLDKNLESLSKLIDGLKDPFETQTQQLQEFILSMVVSLAASVVKRDISLQPIEIQAVVDMAIEALPKSNRDLTIYLHPDDITMLRETGAHKVDQWELKEDPELLRGGVIVRSKDSMVNYSITEQLATLEEKLLLGELMQPASPDDDLINVSNHDDNQD